MNVIFDVSEPPATCPNRFRLLEAIKHFRESILIKRAVLPRPGYILDPDQDSVEQAITFLNDLPGLVVVLASQIHDYQKCGGRWKVQPLLDALDVLRRSPLMVFQLDAQVLEQNLTLAQASLAEMARVDTDLEIGGGI